MQKIHEFFRDSLNFRDLGGLKTNSGKKVKSGLFYRGAGLNFFNDEELEYFSKLGIKVIMDLRSKSEIETYPDPYIENVHMIRHSGLVVEGSEDIDWSPAGMRKIGGEAQKQLDQIKGYYKNIAFNNTAFKIMVNQIVDEQLPIYFHCATGKDRTGVAAMIILMILDVEYEEIKKDYLLSNIYRKQILDESLSKVSEQAKDHPELNTLITLQDGVIESTIDTVMNSIKEKYGSFDEYIMKEFDIDKDKLTYLRDKYTA